MLDSRVRVSRNTDSSLLAKTFPEAAQALAAAESTNSLFGEPPPESFDYIPRPGVSTYRGSRSVSSVEGRPWNSPADVVRREIFQHTDYYTDGKIHPSIEHQTARIEDRIGDPVLPPPPSQKSSIPPEFKNVARKPIENGGNEEMNINDIRGGLPHVSARPTPVITNSVPPAPRPEPVKHEPQHRHEHPRPPISYIPPAKSEQPFQPTEEMILKINGYNETNMKLLGEVSKNITRCAEMIAKLNDLTKPINVNEMMGLLEYMDNEAYRALFVQSFENLLNKNLELHNTITMYLSGKGPVEETPEPEDTVPSSDTQSGYPVGNVSVTSANEGEVTLDISFPEQNMETP